MTELLSKVNAVLKGNYLVGKSLKDEIETALTNKQETR